MTRKTKIEAKSKAVTKSKSPIAKTRKSKAKGQKTPKMSAPPTDHTPTATQATETRRRKQPVTTSKLVWRRVTCRVSIGPRWTSKAAVMRASAATVAAI